MPSRNPALNDKIFQRETAASHQGGFDPSWGRPADEVPPGLFGGSTLPPPPPPPAGATTTTTYEGTYGYAGQQLPPVERPVPPTPVAVGDTMRLGGTLSAAAILLGLVMVAGVFGWQAVSVTRGVERVDGSVPVSVSMPPWLFVAWIGGFALAMVTIFKPKVARFSAPVYAVAEGLLVGAISRAFDVQYKGIVLQAVGLTIGVFLVMLVLYATGTIKVTDRLRSGIIAATGAVLLVYVFDIVLRLFGTGVPMIHEAGAFGILFSLAVVGIASFNLLLDFDFIERGVAMKAPRYMEWYGAFGLMVTLIWLYLELLRLLAKLRER
jgi:uncharacterized YccA/Bax inhibitor family protein